jgi:hypothetical protein
MPRFEPFTLPTGEVVYIAVDAVTNVHQIFKTESWAPGTNTAILYGDGLKVGVREDLTVVLKQLEGERS